MDKLIDEWPIVTVNRIHLGLMTASLLKISHGAARGELWEMDWFSIGRPDLDDDVKYGHIDFSNRILLLYSVFAIMDLIMYFRHHPFALWLLNCVHHVFRIFLLATTVAGSAVCIWQTLCQITYCLSCACLYLKIGLLLDEKRPMKFFRRFAKYNFFASIVMRLIGYVLAAYWNFLDVFRTHPVQSTSLFLAYFLFDAAYLTFHCLPHPDEGKEKDVSSAGDTNQVQLDSHGIEQPAEAAATPQYCALNDVFDRELFYPAGEGLIAPLRGIGLVPNHVTLLSGVVQLLGLYLLLTGSFRLFVLTCVFAGYVLDCVDGQMARRYGLVSDLGAMLDTGKDAVVMALYLIAIYVYCGWAPVSFLLLVAFATVARGGLQDQRQPFKTCYEMVLLLPEPLRTGLLSCHGGVFTMCLMFVILMAC
ncbi:uncharacterized protein LOC135807161 [Sycon ciliatum]|uniref:uncharacterized protein LOC135807161 n=1 Tax=Sycon ciliatum TaxID=27933 RepID=UPI0031F60A48